MSDSISREDAVNEIHKYFFEEINKIPCTKDEDGYEVYTDMPTVNSLFVCNKELSKRIKALPSAEAEIKCVAQIDVNTEEVVRRIKEEYDITDGWIPCSERVPKENEYVDNVCKYYLIQDEYGDMHVAHLSGRGWETIESIKALGCDVIAWMPLPKPYRKDGEDDGED